MTELELNAGAEWHHKVGDPFIWKLTNNKFVHPECREDYQKKREKGGHRPGIDAAIYQGFPMSRFTLCDYCQAPIWDNPQGKDGATMK